MILARLCRGIRCTHLHPVGYAALLFLGGAGLGLARADHLAIRPAAPRTIVGVGSSPYVEYGGSGLYVLESLGEDRLRLTLNPDARLVGNSLLGSFSSPAAELEEHRQWFSLKLPGWRDAACYREQDGGAVSVPQVGGGWLLRPGVYHLRRDKRS